MYKLFSAPKRGFGGQSLPPRFHDVQAKLAHDVEHIITHYRSNTYAMPVQHILCRLILAIDIPLHYPLEQYYEAVSKRYRSVASGLGMITPLSAGKWFHGLFYHGCPELILAYEGENRPAESMKVWMDIQAVKVLEHPVSNLKLMLPSGVKHNTERGLVVIGIDVPLLMLQYRAFYQQQVYRAEQTDGQVLGVTHFLLRHVLPNMLKSQTDLVLMNRLMNLHYGAPMGDSLRKHSFYISDYSDWMDAALEKVLAKVTTTRTHYADVLTQIPKVFRDFPTEMPSMPPVFQVWWALFLARSRMITFLLDLGDLNRGYNQGLVNDLFIDLKQLRQDNVYPRSLDPSLVDPVMERIAYLTALVRT